MRRMMKARQPFVSMNLASKAKKNWIFLVSWWDWMRGPVGLISDNYHCFLSSQSEKRKRTAHCAKIEADHPSTNRSHWQRMKRRGRARKASLLVSFSLKSFPLFLPFSVSIHTDIFSCLHQLEMHQQGIDVGHAVKESVSLDSLTRHYYILHLLYQETTLCSVRVLQTQIQNPSCNIFEYDFCCNAVFDTIYATEICDMDSE